MDTGTHWATLVSIIIGLGVTELLMSLHRLIHARKRVIWDPLPLFWATIVLFWLFNYWWAVAAGLDGARQARVVGHFIVLAINPVVLFLLSASILPRSLPDHGDLDMRLEWARTRNTCFALFAINQAVTWGVVVAARGSIAVDFAGVVRTLTLTLTLLALLVRSRRYEWFAAIAIFALVVARVVTQGVR